MWNFIEPIKLIRYLFVWRVNGALVHLPRCLSVEISRALGTRIAERLSTREARSWRKILAGWGEEREESAEDAGPQPVVFPETGWPLKSVVFAYPGKIDYGPGELILWELKLLGESADHGLFLEIILPAVEEAGSAAEARLARSYGLWGRFDVEAVYVARGRRWEPIVQQGQLNLRLSPTSSQWMEGMKVDEPERRRGTIVPVKRLTWLTPFELTGADRNAPATSGRLNASSPEIPTLLALLTALIERMSEILPGKYNTPYAVFDYLNPQGLTPFSETLTQSRTSRPARTAFEPAPRGWPGRWIGSQTFTPDIPPVILPYLELASILHLGKYTHFGCGTFHLS